MISSYIIVLWNYQIKFFIDSLYLIPQTGQMKSLISELETFCLLVACLCHDLDHRGTNNAFQSK